MKTIKNIINGVSTEYKVTYMPIINTQIHQLPQKVQNQIADLFVTSQQNPSQAIPALQNLINRYSHIPQLYNFITTAYSLLDDYEMAESYALESCQIHPDYLFAKINCAEICLRKDEYYKIPIIFNHKMYLQLLYPERDEFHLTEAVGFNGVCGIYYGKIGDRLSAAPYYQTLEKLSPESHMAKQLKALLF
jgi:tetratricopeptide (TPR) repeat protein